MHAFTLSQVALISLHTLVLLSHLLTYEGTAHSLSKISLLLNVVETCLFSDLLTVL